MFQRLQHLTLALQRQDQPQLLGRPLAVPQLHGLLLVALQLVGLHLSPRLERPQRVGQQADLQRLHGLQLRLLQQPLIRLKPHLELPQLRGQPVSQR